MFIFYEYERKGIVNSDNADNSNNSNDDDDDDYIQFKLLYRHLPVPTPFPGVSNPWVLSDACGSVMVNQQPLPFTPLCLGVTHSIRNIFLYHRVSQITLPALLALQTRTLLVTEASSGSL